jgi:hypothetical protein
LLGFKRRNEEGSRPTEPKPPKAELWCGRSRAPTECEFDPAFNQIAKRARTEIDENERNRHEHMKSQLDEKIPM